ncbi:MAG: sporulation protein [Ruminococcaceae bacterium]|nr:sporulation protein [Oscillospiraceae bacterium]
MIRISKRSFQFLILMGLLVTVCSLVIFPNKSVSAAKEGLSAGFGVILPSLFPFFVVSSLMIKTGAVDKLGKTLSPVVRWLFKTGSCGASAFIIGLLGGYPLGAKAVCGLYERGSCSKKEAEHLLGFCSNSGPAFILGACGAGVFQSSAIGLMLLGVHILSAVLVGIAFRFNSPPPSSAAIPKTNNEEFPIAFVNAVKDSFKSVLDICGFVIFFGVIMELLSLPSNLTGIFIEGFIELTSAIFSLSTLNLRLALPLCSFFLGWGGLCVHCQALSFMLPLKLKTGKYFLGKLLQGIISALLTFAICS